MIKNDIEELRYKKTMENVFGEDWKKLFDAAYSAVSNLIIKEAERDINKSSVDFSRYENPFRNTFDNHVFMHKEVGRNALKARFKEEDCIEIWFGYDSNYKDHVDHLHVNFPKAPEYLASQRPSWDITV